MSQQQEACVLGAGGHAKVVLSTLRDVGIRVRAVFDDDESKWGLTVMGVLIRGPINSVLDASYPPSIIAIGGNARRKELSESLPVEWLTLVHPRAHVDRSAVLGSGTVVFAGAVVQPEVRIGCHVIVNTGATADHECVIGDHAHLGPGSHLAGAVTVEEGAMLGIGCSIISGVRIGAWATVGAGAAVVKDLPANVVAVGVPARAIRNKIPALR